MSKHYSKYNRPVAEPEQTSVDVETVEEAVVVEETVEEAAVVEAVVAEEPKSKVGVVVDCEKLRVRKHPATVADILCLIPKGAVVIITGETKNSDFYSVCTDNGVHGYCMKKYIKVQ